MKTRGHHEAIAAAAGLGAEGIGALLLAFSVLLRPVAGAIRSGATKTIQKIIRKDDTK